MKENIIIVPIYKTQLSSYEKIALQQCFNIFSEKKIIAIKPKSLSIDELNLEFFSVVSFEDYYFKNIHGYNRLMLSIQFYERFLEYNFMLIYQTDAFVFSDQLDYWSNSGFDYIGAPWLKPLKNDNIINKLYFEFKCYLYTKFNVKRNGLPKSKQFYNKVGNGGFSLRNINLFHSLVIKERALADYYIQLENLAFNEDLFWSIEINRHKKRIKIPTYKEAVKFSLETYPDFGFHLNHQNLPFGCHAWPKFLSFWKEKIEANGYKL